MRYLLTFTAASFLAVDLACADGMMTVSKLGQSVDVVESPKQEALIVLDTHAKTTTVSLRTHFRAGPTDLAWVVPVPASPEDIKEGKEHVFRELQDRTAPEFWVLTRTGSTFGCGASSQSVVREAVTVVDTGVAGIFDYVVLTSSSTESLVHWLNENNYRVPSGAEPVFRRYVDFGWHWLAIRVRTEVKHQPNVAPHPITYSYRRAKVEYPLVISAISAAEKIEVVLYVLADCEYGGEDWANVQIPTEQLKQDDSSSSGTNYESLFRQLTADNGGHLLVTEFASRLDTHGHRPLLAVLRGLDSFADVLRPQEPPLPFYLTRLRAIVDRDALDRDVVLVPTRVSAYDFVLNSHQIRASSEERSRSAAWLATVGLAVVLAALYYRLRRHRFEHSRATRSQANLN